MHEHKVVALVPDFQTRKILVTLVHFVLRFVEGEISSRIERKIAIDV